MSSRARGASSGAGRHLLVRRRPCSPALRRAVMHLPRTPSLARRQAASVRNGSKADISSPEVRWSQMLHEVGLAERYAGVAEDGIRSRRVEKEIGKRKARQVLTATETIARAIREPDKDFPIFAAFESARI